MCYVLFKPFLSWKELFGFVFVLFFWFFFSQFGKKKKIREKLLIYALIYLYISWLILGKISKKYTTSKDKQKKKKLLVAYKAFWNETKNRRSTPLGVYIYIYGPQWDRISILKTEILVMLIYNYRSSYIVWVTWFL